MRLRIGMLLVGGLALVCLGCGSSGSSSSDTPSNDTSSPCQPLGSASPGTAPSQLIGTWKGIETATVYVVNPDYDPEGDPAANKYLTYRERYGMTLIVTDTEAATICYHHRKDPVTCASCARDLLSAAGAFDCAGTLGPAHGDTYSESMQNTGENSSPCQPDYRYRVITVVGDTLSTRLQKSDTGFSSDMCTIGAGVDHCDESGTLTRQ